MITMSCDRCGQKINGRSRPSARRVLLTSAVDGLPRAPNLFLALQVLDPDRPNLVFDICQPCLRALVISNTVLPNEG